MSKKTKNNDIIELRCLLVKSWLPQLDAAMTEHNL